MTRKEILCLHNAQDEFRIFRYHIQGYSIENGTIILFREHNSNILIKNETPWDNWEEFIQDLRNIFTQENHD